MATLGKKGFGLWNTLSGVGTRLLSFFDNSKGAFEEGAKAAAGQSKNAADNIITALKGSGHEVDGAMENLIRNGTAKSGDIALSTSKTELGKGGLKKVSLWTGGILAAGTVLATTGLGQAAIAAFHTMNETAESEAGLNKTFYGFYAFIKKIMEDFGLDKQFPGVNNFLAEKLNTHKGANGLAAIPQAVEDFVPDILDQNNSALAITEVLGGTAITGIVAKNIFSSRVPDTGKTPDGGGDKLDGDKPGKKIKEVSLSPSEEIDAPKGHSKLSKIFGFVTAGAVSLGLLAAMTSDSKAEEGPTDNAADPKEDFNLAAEVAHRAQVFGHGFQDGVVSLVAAPESLYDMADGLLGGILPGDDKTNSTSDVIGGFADEHLIQRTELRDAWDKGLDFSGQAASWLIPLGGVAKAVGMGAKGIKAVTAYDHVQDITQFAAPILGR